MGTRKVLLVQVLILAFLGTWASMPSMLTQLVPSNTKRSGNTAFLECQVNVTHFENVYIHWYRQKPGGPLIRILYLSSNENVIHEEGFSEERYEAKKRERDFSASLRIHQVTEADEGLYYCACWDNSGWVKNFAEGSQLIVLRSESVISKKTPTPIIFLPTSKEVKEKKSGTYICLLEDFFPNVIKTYWKENNNPQPLDAQFGPIIGNGSSYSQISWLTIQEDSLRKKEFSLSYFYQHENTGIEPKEVPIPSVWEALSKDPSSKECEKTEDWIKGFQKLHFANTSAFYTYTILLVKSTMYFTIILFFLYRKRMAESKGSK